MTTTPLILRRYVSIETTHIESRSSASLVALRVFRTWPGLRDQARVVPRLVPVEVPVVAVAGGNW